MCGFDHDINNIIYFMLALNFLTEKNVSVLFASLKYLAKIGHRLQTTLRTPVDQALFPALEEALAPTFGMFTLCERLELCGSSPITAEVGYPVLGLGYLRRPPMTGEYQQGSGLLEAPVLISSRGIDQRLDSKFILMCNFLIAEFYRGATVPGIF